MTVPVAHGMMEKTKRDFSKESGSKRSYSRSRMRKKAFSIVLKAHQNSLEWIIKSSMEFAKGTTSTIELKVSYRILASEINAIT